MKSVLLAAAGLACAAVPCVGQNAYPVPAGMHLQLASTISPAGALSFKLAGAQASALPFRSMLHLWSAFVQSASALPGGSPAAGVLSAPEMCKALASAQNSSATDQVHSEWNTQLGQSICSSAAFALAGGYGVPHSSISDIATMCSLPAENPLSTSFAATLISLACTLRDSSSPVASTTYAASGISGITVTPTVAASSAQVGLSASRTYALASPLSRVATLDDTTSPPTGCSSGSGDSADGNSGDCGGGSTAPDPGDGIDPPFIPTGSIESVGLGDNPNFNGWYPFSATDTLQREISSAPVDPMNGPFQQIYGVHGLPLDTGGFHINVIDTRTQSVTWYPVQPTVSGDRFLMPIVGNEVLEGQTKTVNLHTCWQNTAADDGGDHHLFTIDRATGFLYETYQAGICGDHIQAYSAKLWDTAKSADRQNFYGGDSVDAAGLVVTTGLLRYEEVAAGHVNHAVRFTAPGSSALLYQNGSTYCGVVTPATHGSGGQCHGDPSSSPISGVYGMRLRLKRDFQISGYSREVQTILRGFKQYGIYFADTGGYYSEGFSDPRFNPDDESIIGRIPLSNFELVTVGNDGVRSIDTRDDANGSDSVLYAFSQTANPPGSKTAYTPKLTVIPNPYNRPAISVFSASAKTVKLGTPVTFTLKDTNSQIHYIDNAPAFRGDTVTVTPTQTTTYTAYSRGTYGFTISKPITVTVTGPSVATPVFSLKSGAYTSVQSVTLSDATDGATIHYSAVGDTTCNSPEYKGPITVGSNMTITAMACKSGLINSAQSSATYQISIPGSVPQFIGQTNSGGLRYSPVEVKPTFIAGNSAVIMVGWYGIKTRPSSVTCAGKPATLVTSQASSAPDPTFLAAYFVAGLPGGLQSCTVVNANASGIVVGVFEVQGTSGVEAYSSGKGTSKAPHLTCGNYATKGPNRLGFVFGSQLYAATTAAPGYSQLYSASGITAAATPIPAAGVQSPVIDSNYQDNSACVALAVKP